MNIFLLDHHDALGRYIASLDPAFAVYTVVSEHYQVAQSMNSFFQKVLKEKTWRLVGTGIKPAPTEGASLLSLTKGSTDGSLFLINVNLKTRPFSARQHQEGVELLKHIRLTEELGDARNLHAMLYSFEEQLKLLKRNPGNLIMLSQGVTFRRIPDGFPEWTTAKELSELAAKRANVGQKDLRRFVQCDYQPPDSAHQFSNWWGIQQLVDAAKKSGCNTLSMPERVEKELQNLNNKKTLFLYKSKERNDTPQHTDIIKTNPNQYVVMHIDDESEWSFVLKEIIQIHMPNTQFIPINKEEIPICLTKKSKEAQKKAKAWVNDLLKKYTPDLVFVDLRLYGNHEVDAPVNKTSGANVAQLLRDRIPGTPIILLTASNKSWVFEEMMKLGVDAYWMKEGIGDHLSPQGSLNNYIRLRELINIALGNKYQFLNKIVRSINEIKNNPDIWWKSDSWKNTVQGNPPELLVYHLLNSIILLIREYLHLFEMKYGYAFKGDENWKKATLLNAVLMESRKVIEAVHQVKSDRISREISDNGDNISPGIFSDCSWIGIHAKRTNRGGTPTDFAKTEAIISRLLKWLQEDPRN